MDYLDEWYVWVNQGASLMAPDNAGDTGNAGSVPG